MLVEFLETSLKFRKRKKSRPRVFTSSTKRPIRKFHVLVVQWRQRNVRKKCNARAELFFCLLSLLFVWLLLLLLLFFFFDVLVAVAVVVAEAPYWEKQRPCTHAINFGFSSPYSAKQQREMTKFKVLWKTWAHDGKFFILSHSLLKLINNSSSQNKGNQYRGGGLKMWS